MKACDSLIFFLLAANLGFAQQKYSSKQLELVNNAFIEFESIDPSYEDFSDLLPLKKIIADARVVQIGEHTHGDGAVFHAKSRLIKFLHQHMGFTIVAIESGRLETTLANDQLREKDSIYNAVQNKIHLNGKLFTRTSFGKTDLLRKIYDMNSWTFPV